MLLLFFHLWKNGSKVSLEAVTQGGVVKAKVVATHSHEMGV